MLRKGIHRCLALMTLAVAGLLLIGCPKNQDQGGKLLVGKKKLKVVLAVPELVRQANAYPSRIVIKDYGTHPGQTITWHYTHKKSLITFKDRDVGAVSCIDDDGECTLTLPKDLLPAGTDKRILKYTVGGEDDNGKLDDNDPDIEIDR